jgi:hypothetical protein
MYFSKKYKMKAKEILLIFSTTTTILVAILFGLSHFGNNLTGHINIIISMFTAAIIVGILQNVVPGLRKADTEKRVRTFVENNWLPGFEKKHWVINDLEIMDTRNNLYYVMFDVEYLPLGKRHSFSADVSYSDPNSHIHRNISYHLNRKEKEWATAAGTDMATIRKQWKRDNRLNELGI